MTVTIQAGAEGAKYNTTQSKITKLVSSLKKLAPANANIIVDAGEYTGQGETSQSIINFINSGGVWVSYGGYPFFFNSANLQNGGTGRFNAILSGIGATVPTGFSFWNLPNGPGDVRVANMPTSGSTPSTLPAGWVSSQPVLLNGYTLWQTIGIPGKNGGWWFYSTGDVQGLSPQQYAQFIVSTAYPSQQSMAPMTSGKKNAWMPILVIGGGVLALAMLSKQK